MQPNAKSAWHSIAVQLPVSVAVILIVVVTVVSSNAYREVRHQAVDSTYVRLDVVSERLSITIDQAFQQLATTVQAIAHRPTMVDPLVDGGPEAEGVARAELVHVLRLSPQVLGVSLWDLGGRQVVRVIRPPLEGVDPWAGAPAPPATLTVAQVARVEGDGTRTWYDAVGVVRRAGEVVGHVLISWQIGGSAQADQVLRDLVGLDARFAIGVPGGKWTDLAGLTSEPEPASAGLGRAEYGDSSGLEWFAVGRQVAGLPFQIWVQAPKDFALAGSRRFLRRSILGGAAILAIAGLAAIYVSRRVTDRLDHLAETADAIAEGRFVDSPLPEGQDELGRLARSFNVMTRKIWESRRQLERRVAERTAELQGANQELEAFTYSASHDLRAPLRSMVGFAQLVQRDYGQVLDQRAHDYLERIRAAGRRMQGLIEALLEFSRTNRQELVSANVDLSAMAREIAQELRHSGPSRKVKWEIADNLEVDGDHRLLAILLGNLLGNAWKFTSYREVAEIEVGELAAEGQGFFVRDNGAGFDMKYASRLFAPFQRLHNESEFQGTGIGLSLVRRIVERHQGRVWAEGEVDRGATFYVSLSTSAAAGALVSIRA